MHSNTKNSKLDIAIHESGHIILSKVYHSYFEIKEVILNKELSEKFDRTSNGGVNFGVNKDKMNCLGWDGKLLISLGGIWAEKKTEGLTIHDSDLIFCFFEDDYKYSGDYMIASQAYEKIIQNTPIIIDFNEYCSQCISFIFANFDNEIITKTLQLLSNSIACSLSDKLDKSEIDLILDKSDFYRWLSENEERIKNERFKFILSNFPRQSK